MKILCNQSFYNHMRCSSSRQSKSRKHSITFPQNYRQRNKSIWPSGKFFLCKEALYLEHLGHFWPIIYLHIICKHHENFMYSKFLQVTRDALLGEIQNPAASQLLFFQRYGRKNYCECLGESVYEKNIYTCNV